MSHQIRRGLLFCVSFVFLVALALPVVTYAQGAAAPLNPNDTFGVKQVGDSVALVSTDIRVIIGRVIQVILGLLGAIAVGLIIYAGFTIMTAGGSEDKVGEGKKILVNATVGLIIILSAMGIVQFVLSSLSQATGSGLGQTSGDGDGSGAGGPKKYFTGSGSLGKIIKDHYPMRDQKGIPRNSKIALSFNESIAPESIMDNTNNTCWGADGKPVICADGLEPYYGDCAFDKPGFNWEKDCDQLKTDSVQIYAVSSTAKTPQEKILVSAAVLATYDASKKINSFTFRPSQPLGSDKQAMWYEVALTHKIRKDNEKKTDAFENVAFNPAYAWQFETSINFDFSPPLIIGVYPDKDSTIDRNTIVQIQFNEAIDLKSLEGALLFKKDLGVTGAWVPSNGFKTVEFVSDKPCGQNSCGETMYCLPVPTCSSNNASCVQNYELLVRTALLVKQGQTTFDGKPGTGILDMSSNALDGNANGKPDGRPEFNAADPTNMTAEEVKPMYDNYFWKFGIKNNIDLSAPYIEQVSPGLDQEGVNGVAPAIISFSKPMMNSSLYEGIEIIEHEPAKNPDGKTADWWIVPSAKLENNKTQAIITHREFGPNGQDLFYFTAVSSSLKSLNQNCLYPGTGPTSAEKGASPLCIPGNPNFQQNCIPVDKQAGTDTGCAVTDGSTPLTTSDVSSCVTKLKALVKPKPKTP